MQSLLRIDQVIEKLKKVINCVWLTLTIHASLLDFKIAPGMHLPSQELRFLSGPPHF